MEKEKTIAQAFGLTDDWADENKAQAFKSWDKKDVVNEMFDDHLRKVAYECLGDTEGLSEYERKVYMSGFHMGVIIHERKMMERMMAKFGHKMLADMVGKISIKSVNDEDGD